MKFTGEQENLLKCLMKPAGLAGWPQPTCPAPAAAVPTHWQQQQHRGRCVSRSWNCLKWHTACRQSCKQEQTRQVCRGGLSSAASGLYLEGSCCWPLHYLLRQTYAHMHAPTNSPAQLHTRLKEDTILKQQQQVRPQGFPKGVCSLQVALLQIYYLV
jgi:hypothetical protein